METSSNDYHISFFKPTTPQAKANRNMVVWFVLIWAVAIFGFQIALRILEKPTPEPAYLQFEEVWPVVLDGTAGSEAWAQFGQAALTVLCKVAIEPDEQKVLRNAVSHAAWVRTPDSLRGDLLTRIGSFEQTRLAIDSISDPAYIEQKKALMAEVSPVLGLTQQDIRTKILPLELITEGTGSLQEDTRAQLPGVMEKYLIHNQSVLTDTRFLGFPFHYFYTAIFLLIFLNP